MMTHTSPANPFLQGFDPMNRKQVEEIKKIYQVLKREGRTLLGLGGKKVESFQDVLEHGMLEALAVGDDNLDLMALRILDETGDRRILWNIQRPEDVKQASALFQEYIAKGWKAYAIHRMDPKLRGVRVLEFNPDLEEVVFDDRTEAEKLKNFDRIFKEPKADSLTGASRTEKLKKFAERFNEVKLLPKKLPG